MYKKCMLYDDHILKQLKEITSTYKKSRRNKKMKIILQEVINGKEIDLKCLRRADRKWLMIELIDRNLNFQVINNILKIV